MMPLKQQRLTLGGNQKNQNANGKSPGIAVYQQFLKPTNEWKTTT
jgi:hypothetical protein